MTELERELRGMFEVREEGFAHAGMAVELVLPRAADALIDDEEFGHDERLPYWAELWPSARALARHLLDAPPAESAIVELGCGLALPSLALRRLGKDPLATDYYTQALRFAQANAERNALAPLRTAHLDWRNPLAALQAELVLAADVLYEVRNAEALAELLPRLVAPGGRVLLADPGRTYQEDFRSRMHVAGWRVEEVDVRSEVSDAATGATSTVRIFELRPSEEVA